MEDCRSELRSEENERCKHQWNHQMRARVTQRLGSMRSGLLPGVLPHKISGFLGTKSRRRPEIVPTEPKPRLEQLVDSHLFQMFCSIIIVANAIFIGVQMDTILRNAAADPPVDDPPWFHICRMVFVAEFTAEILLRMVAKRWRFICGDDWKWNVFDLFLVAYSAIEEILHGFNLAYTRLLRGFRMVRVLRVIRVMRFFRELRLMVCSIVQSVVSLSWAMLLLLLVTFLFSICFMHAVAEYLHGGGDEDVAKNLKEWYGSIGNTMFSLLLAVSGGADWITLVEPLAHISVLYQVLFSFYVLFVVIGVLNVLTSAFVQRACELSRLDRDLVIQSEMISDEAFTAEMKGIFEEVDIDGEGKITWQKFREYLQNEDVQAYFATQQLDTTDARELFNLLDVGKNEEVGIEEFIMGCKKLRGQAKSSDVATLLRESKRNGAKHLRAVRKIEAQLRALRHGMQVIAGVDYSHASWLRSPTSVSSYPHTPGSAMSGGERSPMRSRPSRATPASGTRPP
uniref:EF-hand domain-containing protein n=1 Tax=Pyrodinium bahamense TaxID=73915 RepID=A0A7R9ZW58_9DINO